MKILRLPQVIEKTGTSKTTIYRWINANQFPRPINLTHASVGWLEADINDWIQSKIEARG
ncbi:helix-turn-helix transcriptional regulator [Francisella adeliensis]|uniref:AlpA family transcriptional regulator n=1 Tax=Francisella adeliensis TaxID=2007306 RepID=A0A2Z4XXJ4_9GAMM|nr:AlpA family transcriptional regulator [Francisella adeliensis]AXA33172.1 AlpA family transcriptional regulator [Francisella adeliensis]MBK2085936.1 AlpA family transcriptional regulator [Francisella adeliensis]MBK2096900.1 AlpA family transcriptional regulator [Francisella adeliensis]QIW11400.1 AlpA family transcriptional regulator [Francisella adeliensis]QIW13275.1 AlpA family transcriptional regulator [Francisella adeliensis]